MTLLLNPFLSTHQKNQETQKHNKLIDYSPNTLIYVFILLQ